jgi:hypothetical protein
MAKKKVEKETLPVKQEGEQIPAELDAGTELAKAESQSQIYYAVLLAKKFPRDETRARNELLTACDVEPFAEGAFYSFPRGRKFDEETEEWKPNIVSGPSIKMARECARAFENIHTGFIIAHDDDDSRGIVAYAWDLQKNVRTTSSDHFKKLIQKKQKGGEAIWVTPDERELRELTNRRASIIIRNAILSLFPSYLVDQFVDVCKRTAAGGAKTDLKDRVLRMQRSFAEMGIPGKGLENYLQKPLSACTRDDLADLRGIYESIRDGMLSKEEQAEFFGTVAEQPKAEQSGAEREPLTADKLKKAANQQPQRRAAKKETKAGPAKGNGEEEKLSAKETALQLIEDATEENFSEVKKQVMVIANSIKNTKDLSAVTIALSGKQSELLKK